MFGAYSPLNSLGKQGYQILMAHGLQNADYLRDRSAKSPGAVVVAAENCGPSVGFRLYDPVRVSDPIAELLIEKTSTNAAENQQRLADNTSYHRRIFLNRGKVGLYTNWIQYVTHSDYDESGQWVAIPGEKAVFMNPQKTSKGSGLFDSGLKARGVNSSCNHQRKTTTGLFTVEVGQELFQVLKSNRPDPFDVIS